MMVIHTFPQDMAKVQDKLPGFIVRPDFQAYLTKIMADRQHMAFFNFGPLCDLCVEHHVTFEDA